MGEGMRREDIELFGYSVSMLGFRVVVRVFYLYFYVL